MRRFDTRLQHVSNVLAIGTGIAYAWAKYLAPAANPYSSASAWEGPTHSMHVLGVPLLVFACGFIWRHHVLPMWHHLGSRSRSKTFSGLGLIFVLVPMIATGYLIQVTVEENWRKAWVIVHLTASAAWSLSYLVHFLGKDTDRSSGSGPAHQTSSPRAG